MSDFKSKLFVDLAEALAFAQAKHAPMNSAHEGWAIIKEELDELWEEVRGQNGARDPDRMYKEAMQIAAMGLRFAHDIVLAGRSQK